MDSIGQPRILLAASLWWPLSARLASRLVDYGARVVALCPEGHVLRHVTGMESVRTYDPLDSLGALEAALESVRPDFVIPCDDRVVAQLHELHERRPSLRALIESSLGPAASFATVSRRDALLETAESLGIRAPETRRVASVSDVRAWFKHGHGAAVLKRDGTWGGDGVAITRSETEAVEAFRKLGRQPSAAFALKRLVVNRDPLSLWAWRRRAEPVITIQSYVSGRPANAMLACWRGKLLGLVVVEVVVSQGTTGAAIVVRLIANEEIARAARLLADRLSLTGFFGLDFMLDGETGDSYLIEMNPRCTQLGHLSLAKQGDLVGLLFSRMSGRLVPEPRAPLESDVVAFFPQALFCDTASPLPSGSHLDVPWGDPHLVHELLRPPWPDRHLIARLYHAVNPPVRSPTTAFDPVRGRLLRASDAG